MNKGENREANTIKTLNKGHIYQGKKSEQKVSNRLILDVRTVTMVGLT